MRKRRRQEYGSPVDHAPITGAFTCFESRLAHRRDILPASIDGRSAPARRYRDLVRRIGADQGGLDALTEARLQLVRRFAGLCVVAEEAEARLANGGQLTIVEHSQLSSTLVRIASRIGLDRIPRDVTTLPDAYLATLARAGRSSLVEDDEDQGEDEDQEAGP
jgi:hypothetical protein